MNTEPDGLLEFLKGIVLLFFFHVTAVIILITSGLILDIITRNINSFGIWLLGLISLFLWQLLYVIPLIIWLKHQSMTGMMKGVITGAVLTALFSVAFYLVATFYTQA